MNFDFNRQGLTKDWSLTAWGEHNYVKVANSLPMPSFDLPDSGIEAPEPPVPSPLPPGTPDLLIHDADFDLYVMD